MRNLYCDKIECKNNFSCRCEYPINSALHLSHDCCGLLKCEEFEDQDAEGEVSIIKIQTVDPNSWTDEEKFGIDITTEKLKKYLEEVKKLAEEQERIGNAMANKIIKMSDLENL